MTSGPKRGRAYNLEATIKARRRAAVGRRACRNAAGTHARRDINERRNHHASVIAPHAPKPKAARHYAVQKNHGVAQLKSHRKAAFANGAAARIIEWRELLLLASSASFNIAEGESLAREILRKESLLALCARIIEISEHGLKKLQSRKMAAKICKPVSHYVFIERLFSGNVRAWHSRYGRNQSSKY